MKKCYSKALLAVAVFMLLNTSCSNCFASPFDEDGIITKIKNGAKEKLSDAKDFVVDKAGDVKDFVVDKAGDVKDFVVDKAKDAKKAVKEGFGEVKEGIKDCYSKATSKINTLFNKGKLPSYVKEAIFIPGHETKEMICQGIAYLPDKVMEPSEQPDGSYYRYVLLSYYPKESDQPSQLIVIDRQTGEPVKRFPLYKKSGKPYTGHAGGVAVVGRYVWVVSGRCLYGFSTQEIINFISDKNTKAKAEDGLPDSFDKLPAYHLTAMADYDVDSKASFISFDGKYIWVGDFAKGIGKEYSPIKHHKILGKNAWVAGYLVDAEGYPTSTEEYSYKDGDDTEYAHKPDVVVAIRDFVQGLAFCDKYVALSISMGPINSRLAMYKNPLDTKSKKITYSPEGCDKSFTVDAWGLGSGLLKTSVKTVKYSCGSEDMEYDGKYLYVAFECSSKNYCQSWKNINPTVKMTEDFYIIDPEIVVKKGK
jgi:hypothetical protein